MTIARSQTSTVAGSSVSAAHNIVLMLSPKIDSTVDVFATSITLMMQTISSKVFAQLVCGTVIAFTPSIVPVEGGDANDIQPVAVFHCARVSGTGGQPNTRADKFDTGFCGISGLLAAAYDVTLTFSAISCFSTWTSISGYCQSGRTSAIYSAGPTICRCIFNPQPEAQTDKCDAGFYEFLFLLVSPTAAIVASIIRKLNIQSALSVFVMTKLMPPTFVVNPAGSGCGLPLLRHVLHETRGLSSLSLGQCVNPCASHTIKVTLEDLLTKHHAALSTADINLILVAPTLFGDRSLIQCSGVLPIFNIFSSS